MDRITKKKFKKIWRLAIPFLKKGKRKNFILHTKGVIKGMKLLLKYEKGNEDILIPANILHDVGCQIPLKMQKSNKYEPKNIRKIKSRF